MPFYFTFSQTSKVAAVELFRLTCLIMICKITTYIADFFSVYFTLVFFLWSTDSGKQNTRILVLYDTPVCSIFNLHNLLKSSSLFSFHSFLSINQGNTPPNVYELISVGPNFNLLVNFICTYRNLPNRGAGCDSKVKSDTME